MFMQPIENSDGRPEEEFKPVESIMRCEDFKSNFARRLSNRYVSKSPVQNTNLKRDTSLKLRLVDVKQEDAPDRIELNAQQSRNVPEVVGEILKVPNKALLKNVEIRHTEVTALTMEVETLRWQLAQTEANRQMHIALLKQIVTFLNRVRDHIEYKKEQPKETRAPRSFNAVDLPRSRSVVHVNKSLEYTLATPKKISGRKISKSISNVNGFKDTLWNPSKLLLTAENSTKKLTEEISRLSALANTVLTTKIPDLAYSPNSDKSDTQSLTSLNRIDELMSSDASDNSEKQKKSKVRKSMNIVDPFIAINGNNQSKLYDFEKCYNLMEDESGFSSMSSFQEIGIPVINISPPTPNKDDDLQNDALTNNNTQQIKVIWV